MTEAVPEFADGTRDTKGACGGGGDIPGAELRHSLTEAGNGLPLGPLLLFFPGLVYPHPSGGGAC